MSELGFFLLFPTVTHHWWVLKIFRSSERTSMKPELGELHTPSHVPGSFSTLSWSVVHTVTSERVGAHGGLHGEPMGCSRELASHSIFLK